MRDRWHPTRDALVGYSVTAIVVVALVATGFWFVGRNRGSGPETFSEYARSKGVAAADPIPFSERPAFEDMPSADELQARLQKQVAAGDQRRTIVPACRCPRRTVWLFGGSAAWGIGQRDQYTIASDLVQLAERDGVGLDVQNFAVNGTTVTEEGRAFEDRLAKAAPKDRPDLVLFYDGFNDVSATIINATLRGGLDPKDAPGPLKPDDLLDLSTRHLDPRDAGSGEAMAAATIDRYRLVEARIRSIARRHDVPVMFFFQPDALTSAVQRRALDGTDVSTADLVRHAEFDDALEATSRGLEPGVANLRHGLDAERKVVFIDVVHTNERGALVIAQQIYRRLRATPATQPIVTR